MSAFMVSHDHIDALLTAACDWKVEYRIPGGERTVINDETATAVGKILLSENARSMIARYGEDEAGECEEIVASYRFKRWNKPKLSAVAVAKGCSCFDYQACETDDYDESLARLIVGHIRDWAWNHVEGYDNAPGWSFSRNK